MKYEVVGRRIPRVDSREKATGKAKFIEDIQFPGMLIGKILRSPYPHARIRSIDITEAKQLKGVVDIVTHKDVPPVQYNSSNRFIRDLTFLPQDCYMLSDRARCVGDRIAAVASVDRETAERALDLIKVDYDVLPAVFDPEEALKGDAPQIHEGKNIAVEAHHVPSDLHQVIAQADVVFNDRFSLPGVHQAHLETHGCLAFLDPRGKLVVWTSTQIHFHVQKLLSHILGIPLSDVEVNVPCVGGGFGGKDELFDEAICSLLALRTNRPVRIQNSREEEFVVNRRHPAVLELKTAVMRDGSIVGRYMKAVLDTGAYAGAGPRILYSLGEKFKGLYRAKVVGFDGYCVYTNSPSSGAFRGYGNPQPTFAVESQMDTIAEELSLDPLEVRLKNHMRVGDIHPGTKYVINSCGLGACIQKGAEETGFREKRKTFPQENRNPEKNCLRGVGMAVAMHVSNSRPYGPDFSAATIRLNQDGSANLAASVAEMGQGALTVMLQIAAEELEISVDRIRLDPISTSGPVDCGGYASRTTYVAGGAVRLAALDAKNKLIKAAAEVLGVDASKVIYRKGVVEAGENKKMTVGEIVTALQYGTSPKGIVGSGEYSAPDNAPNFGCAFAEVEVYKGTGKIKVVNLVSLQDPGKVINPALLEGQMEGAIQQGIGYALTEEVKIDRKTGKVLNDNFLDYKFLTIKDMPVMRCLIVESPDPNGPFGAKGGGEIGLVSIAPAIANAIYHATGIRFRELPIRPEKVLAELNKA